MPRVIWVLLVQLAAQASQDQEQARWNADWAENDEYHGDHDERHVFFAVAHHVKVRDKTWIAVCEAPAVDQGEDLRQWCLGRQGGAQSTEDFRSKAQARREVNLKGRE